MSGQGNATLLLEADIDEPFSYSGPYDDPIFKQTTTLKSFNIFVRMASEIREDAINDNEEVDVHLHSKDSDQQYRCQIRKSLKIKSVDRMKSGRNSTVIRLLGEEMNSNVVLFDIKIDRLLFQNICDEARFVLRKSNQANGELFAIAIMFMRWHEITNSEISNKVIIAKFNLTKTGTFVAKGQEILRDDQLENPHIFLDNHWLAEFFLCILVWSCDQGIAELFGTRNYLEIGIEKYDQNREANDNEEIRAKSLAAKVGQSSFLTESVWNDGDRREKETAWRLLEVRTKFHLTEIAVKIRGLVLGSEKAITQEEIVKSMKVAEKEFLIKTGLQTNGAFVEVSPVDEENPVRQLLYGAFEESRSADAVNSGRVLEEAGYIEYENLGEEWEASKASKIQYRITLKGTKLLKYMLDTEIMDGVGKIGDIVQFKDIETEGRPGKTIVAPDDLEKKPDRPAKFEEAAESQSVAAADDARVEMLLALLNDPPSMGKKSTHELAKKSVLLEKLLVELAEELLSGTDEKFSGLIRVALLKEVIERLTGERPRLEDVPPAPANPQKRYTI